MSSTLRPIVKDYATMLRANGQPLRRECWGATTDDGEWGFERIEAPGTPWIVVHHPRTPHAETVPYTWGTLRGAREAVERGLTLWLPSTQRAAHEAGEHAERHSPYGCPICRDEEWAEWQAKRGQH